MTVVLCRHVPAVDHELVNAHTHALYGCPYLATERAGVFSVLGDFDFLHHLPQRCTITRAIFTNDPHLLGTLGLWTTLTKCQIQ